MNYWRKSRQRLIALLFTGLLLLLPLSVSATESNISEAKMYTITEYQLTELESKLSRLATSNETLALDCKELQEQLAASQMALEAAKKESKQLKTQLALEAAKKESEQLKTQLAELTLQSRSSEVLLQTANASLEAYAKEAKRKTAIIKTQRSIAWVVAGGIFVYAVKHK